MLTFSQKNLTHQLFPLPLLDLKINDTRIVLIRALRGSVSPLSLPKQEAISQMSSRGPHGLALSGLAVLTSASPTAPILNEMMPGDHRYQQRLLAWVRGHSSACKPTSHTTETGERPLQANPCSKSKRKPCMQTPLTLRECLLLLQERAYSTLLCALQPLLRRLTPPPTRPLAITCTPEGKGGSPHVLIKPPAVKGKFTQVSEPFMEKVYGGVRSCTGTCRRLKGKWNHPSQGCPSGYPGGPPQPDGVVPKPFAAQMNRTEQAKSQDSSSYQLASTGL